MRAIATLVFLGLIAAAGPAQAEPQAKAGRKTRTEAKKGQRAPAPGPAARTGFGLGSMAEMAARAAAREGKNRPLDAPRLDLTPQRQLASGSQAGSGSDLRGSERTSGIGLGDDADWKVQAAEVGAMAGIFATLVAVCGNGRCLLPDFFGGGGRDDIGPPPGLQPRDQPELRDAR